MKWGGGVHNQEIVNFYFTYFVYNNQEDRYDKLAVSLLGLVGGKGEKELNDAVSVAVAKENNGFYSKMLSFLLYIDVLLYLFFYYLPLLFKDYTL